MLSFDISDRRINIVKGDNTANKIKIDKSLSLEIPEDMISNAEIVNLTGVADLVLNALKAEEMVDKDAVVTFSSANIVFKELVVPKAKGYEFLTMVQNHMSQEMGITDDYSISYTVVGEAGEDSPGSVKVLATACPSIVVESFRKMFSIMGINLRSVNISCNSISRIVLSDKSNLDQMPLLVCQLDKNFIGLTLFENGQMAFARYVPISAEDYDTDDYVIEALNENIFRMEQFNKARGGPGLSNVILYGEIEDYIKIVDSLDGLEIKASVLGVPSQITGYENFDFTVFANAIAALYKRNKQTERINLLEVDSSTGKSSSGVNSMLITAGVIVAASIIAIGAVTLFVKLKIDGVNKEIIETEQLIAQHDKVLAENQKWKDNLQIIDNYKMIVNVANDNLSGLPVVKKEIFDKIDEVIGTDIEYTGFSYDQASGVVTITDVKLPGQLEAPEFVRKMKDLDYFAEVQFTGYTGKGTEDSPVIISSLILYMKGQGEE